MTSFRAEKALILDHYAALDAAAPGTVAGILNERVAEGWRWRGVHPWNELAGVRSVVEAFWSPFLASFSRVRRRQDVFMAGSNEIDGFESVWTVSMGHLMGLFDAPFLGIPATRRIAMLRYAEFNRVEAGRIVETAFFCDLLHLMRQAGRDPLPSQTAAHLVQPGPATHDGLILGDVAAEEGAKTLALIDRMIGDIASNSNTGKPPRDATPRAELERCWHDDMIWWGPEGIGATFTIDRYIEQHQQPFRRNLSDRVFHGHVCRLAEGSFCGFFGWPNLSVTSTGEYMGVPPTGRTGDMRVVDIYRRDGDRLAENWIFIDMLHFLKMQGIDLLADPGALSAR